MDNFIKLQEKFITQIDNAKATNRISHANIIEGDNSIIIDKAINYFLVSIFEEIDTCNLTNEEYENIINKHNSNIIIYDLNCDTFKKEDSILIQKQFSTTPLEGSKQVYIIKNIDKANVVVMNSLLKFLEEPTKNVYAILTTSNLEKVLETITSRSARYSLLSNDMQLVKECFYPLFPQDDVDLVCEITKNETKIKEILESDSFLEFKDAIPKIFKAIKTESSYPIFYELLNGKDKPLIKTFLELFYQVLTNKKVQKIINLDQDSLIMIYDSPYYSKILDQIISSKVALDTNMNTGLLIDKLSINIEEYLK